MDDKKQVYNSKERQEQNESGGVCAPTDEKLDHNKLKELEINVLKTQGLTQQKLVEIEDMLYNGEDPYKFMCITETQLKRCSLNFNKDLCYFTKYRSPIDKKGGGGLI